MAITISGSGSVTGLTPGGLPDASVQVADLAFSGTPSSSTYARGDGSWATPTGGVTSITAGTGLSGGTITTTGTISLVTTTGAVGTYAFLQYPSGGTISPGGTTAGSGLRYAGVSGGQTLNGAGGTNAQTNNNGAAPAGTWQCMGYAQYISGCAGSFYGATLWMRIA